MITPGGQAEHRREAILLHKHIIYCHVLQQSGPSQSFPSYIASRLRRLIRFNGFLQQQQAAVGLIGTPPLILHH